MPAGKSKCVNLSGELMRCQAELTGLRNALQNLEAMNDDLLSRNTALFSALKDLFQSIDQAAHAKAIQWDRHSPTMTAARKALGL